MNSVSVSIENLLDIYYIKNDDVPPLRYNTMLEGPLKYFLGLEGITKRILLFMVKKAATKLKTSMTTDRKDHPAFYLQEKYVEDEHHYLTPQRSEIFKELETVFHFLSGSKLVFQRNSLPTAFWKWPFCGSNYFHVGCSDVGQLANMFYKEYLNKFILFQKLRENVIWPKMLSKYVV